MTVGELIKELKKYPKEASVYYNNDWDDFNENGNFNNLSTLSDVCDDVAVVDEGLDFEDEHRIILDFQQGI